MTKPRQAETSQTLRGQVASAGFAMAPVLIIAHDRPTTAETGDPAQERDRFLTALEIAKGELATLMAKLDDDDAADLVEFQIAMLEDDTLTDPVTTAIAGGAPALTAWHAEMDPMIADYRASSDAYFRGRASDLVDVRDRVAAAVSGTVIQQIPAGRIVIADDLSPSRFLDTDWTGSGIALTGGSPTSHVAMLARARAVPMLIGVTAPPDAISGPVLFDAHAGTVTIAPAQGDIAAFQDAQAAAGAQASGDAEYLSGPAQTADGRPIQVTINVAGPDDLAAVDPAHCDGIGLVRTELLFAHAIPDEDTQLAAYRRIVAWAGGRPVTFRTLDAGADKPIPGITIDGETNPFLGVRGIRLSLRHAVMFKTQLRALCRAAVDGPVKIMIPMVTIPAEMDAVRRLLAEAQAELAASRTPSAPCLVGMMVEVPAAAIAIADFDADFYSIGSNDLVQYVMAAGRDNANLTALTQGLPQPVRELIARVAGHAREIGREASICGDIAGDPACVPDLLACGLTTLSVAPPALARTKAAIAKSR